MTQSFHAQDWLSTLLALLGSYAQAKAAPGATGTDAALSTLQVGLAIAQHVNSHPALADTPAPAPVPAA